MRLTSLCLAALCLAGVVRAQSPTIANTGPRVSPDGRWVAFVSTRTGNAELFVIDAEGGRERQLTQSPESEGRPEWSRDGTRLRYAVTVKEQSELREVEVATGRVQVLGVHPGRGVVVGGSGALVAFTSGTWQESRLAVSKVDGTNVRLLSTPTDSPVAWNAALSADEAFVAFTGQDPQKHLQVFVASVAEGRTTQVTRLSAEEGRAQVPAFSADGMRLAFQVNRTGNSDIWMINRDGSSPVAVVASRTDLNEVPSWFPSGQAIAFQSNRSGRMEIWVAPVAGGPPRQLTGR